MAAYRRVSDSHHLQADCQEPGSAPEPHARQSSTGFLYLLPSSRLVEIVFSTCFSVCACMLVGATLRLSCRRRLVFLMIQNAHQNQNAQQIRLTWPQKTTDRKLAENSYIQKADFKRTCEPCALLVYWFIGFPYPPLNAT